MDREKVIKELESLRDICNAKSNMAIGNGKVAWAGYANTAEDAIAMLKEQEAVEPIKPLDKDDDYTFMCSNCKGELFCGDVIRDNFCSTCGRSVKWE